MNSFSELTGLEEEEFESLRKAVSAAGLSLKQPLSKMSERELEAIIRNLVEVEGSRERRAKIVKALKKALEGAGNPVAWKLNPRVPVPEISMEERKKGFREVVKGYSLEDAEREASRCLICRNPRCVEACPIRFSVPAFLKMVSEGKVEAAYRLALTFYPFLGVCGRICVRFCEQACIMNEIGGEPPAIALLHRAVADRIDKRRVRLSRKPEKGLRVAVIGSGPAGLNAAYHLALKGYSVTVYEALEKVGGMLSNAIPSFRLPLQVFEEELELVRRLEVGFETGKRVGGEVSLEELVQSYDAVFIAVGAHRLRSLNIPGEELEGVLPGLRLLFDAKDGRVRKLEGRVIVVGGGNVAMDSARTAIRLGAEKVTIIYRRSRVEMPAHRDEVEAALKEGVEIIFLATPVEIIGENGKVKAVKCIRMRLGEPGPDGRRRPIPIPGSEFMVEADYVIEAVGESPDTGWITPETGIQLTRWETIKVDEETLMTSREGVFAGGDAVRGPATFIQAAADGKKAAESIDRYLAGRG